MEKKRDERTPGIIYQGLIYVFSLRGSLAHIKDGESFFLFIIHVVRAMGKGFLRRSF